jgi:hypothetical protein
VRLQEWALRGARVTCDGEDRRVCRNVREESDQFGGLAGV